MMKRVVGVFLILSIGLLFSCKNKKGKDDESIDFNKAAMLENISGNIIVPALAKFDGEVSA